MTSNPLKLAPKRTFLFWKKKIQLKKMITAFH